MKRAFQFIPLCGLLLAGAASGEQITKPHTFGAGTPASAEQVNADFDTLYSQANKVGAAVTVDGSNVGIGTATPAVRLDVAAPPPVDVYSDWFDHYEPGHCKTHCNDTCDGNDTNEFTCEPGMRLQCEDLSSTDGDVWEYRQVECGKSRAAAFSGDVSMTGGKLSVEALALPGEDIPAGAVLTTDQHGNAYWAPLPVPSYAERAGEADNAFTINGQTNTDFAASAHTHPGGEITSPVANAVNAANAASATNADNATNATNAGNADTVDNLHAGNASGNVPVSNGTLNNNLNADLLDGRQAWDFAASGANEDITSLSGLRALAAIVVNPYTAGAGRTGQIRMQELTAYGTDFVGLRAPDNIASSWIMTLPEADGAASQVLTTDGVGHLGWANLNNGTQTQSVTGTDPNGVIRGTNSATPALGYLGGVYGVYGEATGTGTAIFGKNTDTSGALGYGVKGQSGNTTGILGTNSSSCRQVSYECDCDWDTSSQEEVCFTCTDTVCDVPGAGVYGQATTPDYAGQFDGNVKVHGGLSVQPTSFVEPGLVVQGSVGQIASLQMWKNSDGATVASVSRTGMFSGMFSGDGSWLTDVTASHLDINCAEGQILKKVSGSWQCSAPCEVGDMVSCYSGPQGTLNVGSCVAGTRTCDATGWGPCVGMVLPTEEVCHNNKSLVQDNNCNGLMDDVFNSPGCYTMYRDADGDGYGVSTPVCTCFFATGYADSSGDCNDSNPDVHPGSLDWFTEPIPGRGSADWDYNCDGTVTQDAPSLGIEDYYSGWQQAPVPACGETAVYLSVHCPLDGNCWTSIFDATQSCH